MDIFTMEGDVPVICIQGLHIPEFKKLWEKDGTEDKRGAKGLFA